MNILLDTRLAWHAATGKNVARVSLLVRVVGVAFATVILLLASSADGALDSRGDRTTWRTYWPTDGEAFTPTEGALQVNWRDDYYLEHDISFVQVAPLGPDAPVPPGLPRIPAPGEVFLSPALAKLVASDPEVLGQRYGDTIAGTIAPSGLADAGELVAIRGTMAPETGSDGVYYRELPRGFQQAGITLLMRVVVVIGTVVLLFPIAMFIGAAARLNAQESDARLAAFRLAGASPRRVRWIVAWESLLATAPGALIGLGLFYALRPLVATAEFGGASFYPSDFALNGLSALALLLVPAVVVAASFLGLRDVEISPLGVGRRSQRKEVRPVGLLLLVPGFVLLWYVLGTANSGSTSTLFALVLSIVLILAGVALIGTWLGQAVARPIAANVRSGSALLALRRIIADPHGSFRTVSGVTFAVFAGTLFLSLSAALERETLVEPLSGLRPNVIWLSAAGGEDITTIAGLPEGAAGVSLQSFSALTHDDSYVQVQQADCDVLAKVVRIEGSCEGRVAIRAGSAVEPGDSVIVEWSDPPSRIEIPTDAYVFEASDAFGFVPDIILPPGTFADFDTLASGPLAVAPPEGVAPGSRAFEAVRTAIMRAYPGAFVYSAREYDDEAISGLTTMRNLVYAGTFAAFILSGSTAAIAVAGSIIARRQSFALLRMAGVPLGALRRTVMAEAMLPLLLVSLVSAATAVAVSAILIERAGTGSMLPPPAFIVPLIAGLAVGLLLPLMTLPMLGRVTAMERTRFD